MKRKIAISVAVLIVLVVGAPIAAFWWIDGERLESIAADYFERTGGVDMRAERVTRSIGFVPRIEVEGLSLERAGYDEPLLQVERGAVGIVLTSLLFRPIELHDIVVEGAEIELPVDDNGLLYWGRAVGDLLGRLKNAGVRIEGFRASDLRIEGRHTGGRGQASTTVRAIRGTMPAPSALAFAIEDMETSVDIAPPLALAGMLELETLSLDHDGASPQSVSIEGTGRIAEWPLRIAVASGNPLEGEAGRREPIDAEVELGASRAALHGSISRAADRHIDSQIVVDVKDLGAMPDWAASFRLSDPGRAWLVESLSAGWGETTVDGRLRLERRSPRPYLSGRIGLTGLSFGTAGSASDPGTDAGTTGATGDTAGRAAREGASAGRAEGAAGDASGRGAAPSWPDRLDIVDADVTIESSDMELYGFPVAEASAEVKLAGARLRMPVAASAFSGRLSGELAVDAGGGPTPSHHVSLGIEGISTRELLSAAGVDRNVQGGINGEAELDADGAGLASVLESLSGRIRLTMSGGRLSETLAQIADQDLAAILAGSFGGTETTPIRCAIADFDGEAGVLEARTLLIDTGEVKLVGDGDIDAADRRVDLVVRPRAKDFSLLSASAPIRISGPLTAPEFSTDVGEAVTSVLTPIEFGQADDAACSRLLDEARANL